MKSTWPNGMKLERRLTPPHLLYVNGKLIGEVTGSECQFTWGVSHTATHCVVTPATPPPPVVVVDPVPGEWYAAATHVPGGNVIVQVRSTDGAEGYSFQPRDRLVWWNRRSDDYDLPVVQWRNSP